MNNEQPTRTTTNPSKAIWSVEQKLLPDQWSGYISHSQPYPLRNWPPEHAFYAKGRRDAWRGYYDL